MSRTHDRHLWLIGTAHANVTHLLQRKQHNRQFFFSILSKLSNYRLVIRQQQQQQQNSRDSDWRFLN